MTSQSNPRVYTSSRVNIFQSDNFSTHYSLHVQVGIHLLSFWHIRAYFDLNVNNTIHERPRNTRDPFALQYYIIIQVMTDVMNFLFSPSRYTPFAGCRNGRRKRLNFKIQRVIIYLLYFLKRICRLLSKNFKDVVFFIFFFNSCNVGIVRVCPWHRTDEKKKKRKTNSCFVQSCQNSSYTRTVLYFVRRVCWTRISHRIDRPNNNSIICNWQSILLLWCAPAG